MGEKSALSIASCLINIQPVSKTLESRICNLYSFEIFPLMKLNTEKVQV